ncbi:hypothetical protein GALMADRAFT_72626 [Galerina marginata CBS 339.88]|uniref:Uncharacterized protein n=1 Tax=Galerina marginata (strain CBS 339.88) TaxID=685588 RepID=A0A067T004_GALM3|nr:hypothetical protein GALMADRAFT_72626 [Galerina marginata CBS 339.88]
MLCRSPEPSLVSKLSVVDEALHINGSWKKIRLATPGGVTKRFGASLFVYNGYIYVLGGEKHSSFGPFYFDFWRLDLAKLDQWQALSECPIPPSVTRSISNQNIAVWNDVAYYFYGSSTLYCFDLIKMEWAPFKTTFKQDDVVRGSWPYPSQELRESTMTCLGGRLYVFGGHGLDNTQGSDLFLELDIARRQWRRLSGSPRLSGASLDSPGPRVSALSWVVPELSKVFLAFGHVNRIATRVLAPSESERRGGFNYPYDDLWSWDIRREQWTQERIRGNTPGPRSEMAAVYSLKLKKLITFGGYNPAAPHWNGAQITPFSYLADTFVCDIITAVAVDQPPTDDQGKCLEGMECRQVLTRGFPTYRARASLFEDPVSGKIYLFSGYFEQEFIPSLAIKGDVKCFSDIWQLRVDLPGGDFVGIDVEEEARTAKAGPWQRCFSCGSVGSWKKCNGACKGRAFFCDRECLKDGWKEHKIMHGCRKVT